MGAVLGLVERVCQLVKQNHPTIQIWVGGIAVLYVRELLERCSYIDRVSSGHPRYDPQAFANELYAHGILAQLPGERVSFPPLLANKHTRAFIHQHFRGSQPINALNLSTASGCMHRCAFCYLARVPGWTQPMDALFEDLSALQSQYNVRYFEFSDDNFPSSRPRLDAFCSHAQRSGLDLSYFCLGSIDALDAEKLDMMVESGLKRLYTGVDAIHPEHIRQLNKNYTPKQALKTMEHVRGYPIDLTLALVLGSYGETREQIQALYDWAQSINPEVCTVSFLTPYPGTPTFYQALDLGFVPPTSLREWAVVADPAVPKPVLNPAIDVQEYTEWRARFHKLSTRRYRSDIGESLRRVKKLEHTSTGERRIVT